MPTLAEIEAVMPKPEPHPMYRVPGTNLAWYDLGVVRRAASRAQYDAATTKPKIVDLPLNDPFWELPTSTVVDTWQEVYKTPDNDRAHQLLGTRTRPISDRAEYEAHGSPVIVTLPATHPVWALPTGN